MGVHDLTDIEPSFVDPTRNFETFGALMTGLPATTANTLAYLSLDPRNRVPALIRWVREGFAPTSGTYRRTTNETPARTIGAVEWNGMKTYSGSVHGGRFPGVF